MIKGTRRGIATLSISILLVITVLIGCAQGSNVTTLNTTIIDPGDQTYIPFEIWAIVFLITLFFFVHALIGVTGHQFTAIIACILSGSMAWLSGFITFNTVETITFVDENTTVVPISTIYQPAWMSYIFLGFFFVCLLLVIRNAYEVYIARLPEWKQRRYYR